MEFKEILKKVEDSKEFKEFAQEHADKYLAHGFTMHSKPGEYDYQLGYFCPSTGLITVFTVDPVKRLPDDQAFNKEGTVKALDPDKVTVQCSAAEQQALDFLKEKYPNETVTKIIIIVQNLDVQVYNITLVTDHFNILNARIDAASGELISHTMRSILSLRQSDEGKTK